MVKVRRSIEVVSGASGILHVNFHKKWQGAWQMSWPNLATITLNKSKNNNKKKQEQKEHEEQEQEEHVEQWTRRTR